MSFSLTLHAPLTESVRASSFLSVNFLTVSWLGVCRPFYTNRIRANHGRYIVDARFRLD